ncbi:hypothetical protein [Candidatus Poriferisocius sp.]|uniref:hypothetical protein n=1 Tax=Candidatus Poriferisocius sp. TaxID=3101276 RepID=UPI003B5B65E8
MTESVYAVKATRSGDWWVIEVTTGLPASVVGVSQARRLNRVPKIARRLIADLLEVDMNEVKVDVEVSMPGELEAVLDRARQATATEVEARTAASRARCDAAAALLGANLTMREAGQVLGVSHQRIKQLADQAKSWTLSG